MYGSDQSASLEIRGMRELISAIKKIEISLGSNKIGNIIDDEIKIAKKSYFFINKVFDINC